MYGSSYLACRRTAETGATSVPGAALAAADLGAGEVKTYAEIVADSDSTVRLDQDEVATGMYWNSPNTVL